LRRHDLERLTAAVVGAEDVRRGKPHAEPYRLALEQGGLPPESGLAVEDSPNGARSALAAGLATYVITLGGEPHPRVPGARGFIRRLDELLPLLEGA
jgi:beta-phosphoglucomutase-like phosphatase (HAD superfamily)